MNGKIIITKKKAQEKQDEEEIKELEKALKLVEQGRLQAEGKEVETHRNKQLPKPARYDIGAGIPTDLWSLWNPPLPLALNGSASHKCHQTPTT